jgi:hypothetical protein
MTIFPDIRESRETTRGFPSLNTAFPGETGKQLVLSPGKGNPGIIYLGFSLTGMSRGKEKGRQNSPPFPYPCRDTGPTFQGGQTT